MSVMQLLTQSTITCGTSSRAQIPTPQICSSVSQARRARR